jgi:hypothetical protein
VARHATNSVEFDLDQVGSLFTPARYVAIQSRKEIFMHDIDSSRRRFLQLAGGITAAGLTVAALPRAARADEMPHLSEADTTATALGYREDSGKVDAAKSPTHKPGQTCANCRFFQGTDKTAWAGCQLFPGKAVAAKGWCSGYNAKT